MRTIPIENWVVYLLPSIPREHDAQGSFHNICLTIVFRDWLLTNDGSRGWMKVRITYVQILEGDPQRCRSATYLALFMVGLCFQIWMDDQFDIVCSFLP